MAGEFFTAKRFLNEIIPGTPRLCGLDRFVTVLFQEDVSGQLPSMAQEVS